MFDGENCIRCNRHFKFDDLIYRSNALGMCRDCDAKVDPTKEPIRVCPHDGNTMNKEIIYEKILIDKCLACGGIWFDGDEIEIIREVIQREGRNSLLNFFPIVIPISSC